jgi:outer membrane protein assembly factor BamB
MKRNSFLGASLVVLASAGLVLASANAAPSTGEHEAAVKACTTANPMQPVTVVNAVNDGSGIGFSLVWLKDKEGNLWMCDADTDGNVYSYSLVGGDLLEGAGPEMIGLELAADGTYSDDPQKIAEKVCVAYLEGGGKVLVSAPDGLEDDPGFVVFVADQNGNFHLCNATGDAMVWAFEPIGDPIEFPTQLS